MLEEKLLIWKFKRGNPDAVCRIYERYRDDLLRLAAALLNENHEAEDVVHDVFINSGALFEEPLSSEQEIKLKAKINNNNDIKVRIFYSLSIFGRTLFLTEGL